MIIDSKFSFLLGGHASAIRLEKANLILGSSSFGEITITDNFSSDGGAISSAHDSHVQIHGATFHKNFGHRSSSLSIVRKSMVSVENCTFTENEGREGGIFYVNEKSGLKVSKSLFKGNKA